MIDRVANNLARLISDEIHSICPEESMNRFLDDIDGEITDSQFKDGMIMLTIVKDDQSYCLELKPHSWRKE